MHTSKYSPILISAYLFMCLFALISCDENTHEYSHSHDNETEHTHSHDSTFNHEHDSSHHESEANEFMHHSDFETLVSEFENPDREEWQRPDLVSKILGDLSGKTVADIGAGTGYFTYRIAEEAEKVIAIDIDPRMIEYIDGKRNSDAALGKLNIETRLTAEDDPSIYPEETDIVIIVNTYHHIEHRSAYFAKVKSGMKEGGFLAIIDFKKEELPLGPPLEMKISTDKVQQELKISGFTSFEIDTETLKYQYVIIAK